jgi:antitoxin (DNA-binding transcriptional repressor) of toxin-antitoxin stability system
MKTTNIRELEHATSTVLEWVEQGETVQITPRNKVVGIIVPPPREAREEAPQPDSYQRLEELFHGTTRPTGTELVSWARGER